MTKVRHIIFSAFLLGCTFGCEKDPSDISSIQVVNLKDPALNQKAEFIPEKEATEKLPTNMNGIVYNVDLISALDFIKRRGETPSAEDAVKLSKESVLMFEVNIAGGGSVIHSKKMRISNDDLPSYIMTQLRYDLQLTQNGKAFEASDVIYDESATNSNKLRAFLFFSDVKIDQETEIKYNDQLFGAGVINL